MKTNNDKNINFLFSLSIVQIKSFLQNNYNVIKWNILVRVIYYHPKGLFLSNPYSFAFFNYLQLRCLQMASGNQINSPYCPQCKREQFDSHLDNINQTQMIVIYIIILFNYLQIKNFQKCVYNFLSYWSKTRNLKVPNLSIFTTIE